MTMRRALPLLVALLLGAGAALLVACGGGGTKGGIPAASAGELKSQIEDVQQAVDGERCEELGGQLRQVDDAVEALPGTVDQRLRQSLAGAAERLRQNAIRECATEQTPTQTQSTPTQTQEEPVETTPAPEETEPEETAPAPPPATTPPEEEPPPPVEPAPVPPPPPVQPAPVPPATPGGGATPEDEP